MQQGGASSTDGELYWIPVQPDASASWSTPLDNLIPMSRRSVLYDPLCTPLGTLRGELVVPNPSAALQLLFQRRQNSARLAKLQEADGSNGRARSLASPPPSPPLTPAGVQHRRGMAKQRGEQPAARGDERAESDELLC